MEILCIARSGSRGSLRAVERARAVETTAALAAIRANAGDRVAIFAPTTDPGRTLRLATTTVLVDDAYLLTGSLFGGRQGS